MNSSADSGPDIDWTKLAFEFKKTDHIFLAHTVAGEGGQAMWREDAKGDVVDFQPIQLSPAAPVLNYAQAVFEGMKALRTPEGRIVLFRPEENARRFSRSAARLMMPTYPVPWFIDAVERLVRAEARFVPPHHEPHWPPITCPKGSRSLYIRPVMIGSGEILGVSPAKEFTFYIFVSPVGVYREAGPLLVLDSTHRAPRYGIGDVKAAANYPATLLPYMIAKHTDPNNDTSRAGEPSAGADQRATKESYVDVMYLDARHDAYIEEVGSSNFFAILKDGSLVTPRTGSILPGITRDSVMTIAREINGWKVVERDIALQELFDDVDEAFVTGTAAVIVPVTGIHAKGQRRMYSRQDRTLALKSQLQAIQTGQSCDRFGWVHEVAVGPELQTVS